MKISVKTDYAARAVFGLAKRYEQGQPIPVEKLGEEYGISPKFLSLILLDLKRARLVRSVRGKDGGYTLAQSPGEITLGMIIRAMQPEVFDLGAVPMEQTPPSLRRAWGSLGESVRSASDQISVQDLLDWAVESDEMYYIGRAKCRT